MNGMDLLKALSFIDERYVQEAERKKPIRFGRILLAAGVAAAAMAVMLPICLVILLLMPKGGGSADPGQDPVNMDSPFEAMYNAIYGGGNTAAGEAPVSAAWSSQLVRIQGTGNQPEQVTVITTPSELEAYCGQYGLDHPDAMERYDEEYFENHILIMAAEQCSQECGLGIVGVYRDSGELTGCDWIIALEHSESEHPGPNTGFHLLMVELSLDSGFTREDTFTVWDNFAED